MSYSTGHPVRLIGGRLALDFVNTADWSSDGSVVHEKLKSREDLDCWLKKAQLDAETADGMPEILQLRSKLRGVFQQTDTSILLDAMQEMVTHSSNGSHARSSSSLEAILVASALSIVADQREVSRLKMCPAENCGWLFIDETKNSRRTWCSMKTCGNRAKAARHYSRKKKDNSNQ